jgi:ABC-type proline/glycine betaine transport system permease subunit
VTLAAGFSLQTFGDAFRFLWDDRALLATKALEQLQLSAIAIGIAAAIALPLGVWLGHAHRGYTRDQCLEPRSRAAESR